MNIDVANLQRRRVRLRPLRTLAAALMALATRRARTHWTGLSIALVDDKGMEELNVRYLGHPGPTDVITFAYPPPPGGEGWQGEIVLNVQQAVALARSGDGNASRELAWYLAHGCDHLSGATDDTPRQRQAMHRRERAWLRTVGQQVPLDGLL